MLSALKNLSEISVELSDMSLNSARNMLGAEVHAFFFQCGKHEDFSAEYGIILR